MRQEALDAVNAHCKKATGFADAVRLQHGSAMRQQAMKQLGRLLLTGAGVGVGARGLLGLVQMGKRNVSPPTALGGGAISVDVPVPVEEEEKFAGAMGDFFRGDYAKNPSGIPWMIPATVIGGAGSIYGGWKLMDSVLDARRKKELRDDVESAKSDFHQALLSEFDRPARVPKLASDRSLGEDLEKLYENVKSAGFLDNAAHAAGVGTGVYGTIAGFSGLATAIGAYQATKKRQEQELLRKAHKMRLRQRWMQQPPPLVANPVQTVNEEPETPEML